MAIHRLLWSAILVGGCSVGLTSPVLARPEYNKEFWVHYAKQINAHAGVKCVACHEGTDKKNRNIYGKAVKDALGESGVKDPAKIKAAFDKVAKEKSAIDGKTFGDLINDGKLPAAKP